MEKGRKEQENLVKIAGSQRNGKSHSQRGAGLEKNPRLHPQRPVMSCPYSVTAASPREDLLLHHPPQRPQPSPEQGALLWRVFVLNVRVF